MSHAEIHQVRLRGRSPWLFAVMLACCLAGASIAANATAAEPAMAFLEQLRARGYLDMAQAYLERLEQKQISDEEFQQAIAYHRGETLIQAALLQRTLSAKESDLDRAQGHFERFVQSHPQHSLVLAARGRMGDILVERARLLVAQAEQSQGDRSRRKQIQDSARQLFAEAADTYRATQAELRKKLEAIPRKLSPDKDAALIEQRDQMRNEYVQAQFVAAMLLYEEGLSYDAGDAARRDKLLAAEKAFGAVAEKYRQRMAGLSAVLFQGRCRQRLGEPRKALAYFEDLLVTLPEADPALRSLRTKTLRNAMECWLDPEINQLETIRQRGSAWMETQRPDERGDDDWLALKLVLAQAYHRLARQDPGSREGNAMSVEARRLAIEVAKYRGDSQQTAQELLAELGQTPSEASPRNDIKSFGDAVAAARDALSRRQVAAQTVELLERRVAEGGADAETLRQRLEEGRQQVRNAESEAVGLLRRAQELVTEETSTEQINQVRFYLCTAYYYQADYFAAAVIADFLASRYPASEEGRRAAAVSLASLVRLYGDGTATGSGGLRKRIGKTAERIAAQWKGQPEADDALATLVTLAIQEGEPEVARQYLNQMSEGSPRRSLAEIAAGQALWNVAQKDLAEAGDPTVIETRMGQAIDLMTAGLQGNAGVDASAVTVAATVLVAEHNLRQGKPVEAITLLELPNVGPKRLADAGHPLTQDPALKLRIYQVALLSYVAAIPVASGQRDYLDDALATLGIIQDITASGGYDLSATYVALAQDLQQQVREATPGQRAQLVRAFQQFLDRAADSSGELSVLTWVADAYLNLAQSLGGTDGADSFFEKSVATYEKILRGSDAGTYTMTNQDRLLVETRLAMVYREQGNYEAAVREFARILKRENTQLFIQVEAAKTFQAWGADGNPSAFLQAILGDLPDDRTKKNIIWGFGRIAKLVAGKRQFDELFHQTRYELAACRYQYALTKQGKERTETLKQAEQDIVMTAKLYPELGGNLQRDRYDGLLKEIRKQLGQPVRGLP